MRGRIILGITLLFSGFTPFAQTLPRGLSEKEKGRYEKAQDRVVRADEVHQQVDGLNVSLKDVDKQVTGDKMAQRIALSNEIYQRTISAGSVYTGSFGDIFSVLSNSYQRYKLQNPDVADQVQALVDESSRQMKNANQLYRKSRRYFDENQAVDMALQALSHQKESIERLLHAGSLMVNIPDEAGDERFLASQLAKKELGRINDSERSNMEPLFLTERKKADPVTQINSKVLNPAKEYSPFVPGPDDVYYTVQFKTLTRMVPVQNVKPWYDGKEQVEINRIDQYYRYSVGKFDSVEQAGFFLKKEGVHGFIVAYQGAERISLVSALRILGH